jgi:hypothetical protein
MKDMDENRDAGGSDFEERAFEELAFAERVRALFEDGAAARGVSAPAVIDGARRRRTRRRATAAGSSAAVLGVAAGVVAFGMHPGGSAAATGTTATSTAATSTAPAAKTATTPTAPTTTESAAAPAQTCTPSVTGTVPALTPGTFKGLDMETLSGTTAGIPWTMQIHLFPDRQTWVQWRAQTMKAPVPPAPNFAVGPPAMFSLMDPPDAVVSTAPGYFGFVGGGGIGPATSGPRNAYVVAGRMASNVDHLCLQFAHRAEFVPVYRVSGGSFAVAAWSRVDGPSELIGYDAAGQVVGKKAVDGDGGESSSSAPLAKN